ncbi:MAG: adenylyl-sulfate kinase [Gammaproteobacteria bacterium HGW-Gammaproteobacteria-11]|nr:MAG: adenylyl-sulfate kinase [Gammaproteobacteria bacterium HGW-Gammaproteobacteria-11]
MRSAQTLSTSQKSCLVWFTGLSASGKSTTASALDMALCQRGYRTFVLDGDNVRHGLCKDLGFSDQDRAENIRRVAEVGKLLTDAGLIVLSAFISPFMNDRLMVRDLMPAGAFIEVFMSTPLCVCEGRDPKGLYEQARAGQIKDFTGIDSPYEAPDHPEVRLDTSTMTVDECVNTLIGYLLAQGLIK